MLTTPSVRLRLGPVAQKSQARPTNSYQAVSNPKLSDGGLSQFMRLGRNAAAQRPTRGVAPRLFNSFQLFSPRVA
jgi:hypothetical protein